jgi:hypothetical protein
MAMYMSDLTDPKNVMQYASSDRNSNSEFHLIAADLDLQDFKYSDKIYDATCMLLK